MPECMACLPSERLVSDINFVKRVFDYLDIECSPLSVYRMGQLNPSLTSLLKVVLPSSFYASQVLRRAPRLKHFSTPKIFIRPSLAQEERNRARAERLARRKGLSAKPVSSHNGDIDNASPNLVDVSDASIRAVVPNDDFASTSNL
ncbi:hypothetical protein GCK32_018438 [Trichostrongylus colubriformis]|uniref:Uncharacterized protein n=1 Tax=Trichostrongylus colubriformis TaxID=6319 RepID=A0AAN8EUT4_TRICO